MQLDEFLDQRKTDAGSLERSALLVFDTMKTLEKPR